MCHALRYLTFVAAVLLTVFSSFAQAQRPARLNVSDLDRQLSRDIFRELIEINTGLDSGCTKASLAMAERFRKAGFPESDIQIVGPAPKHMNLVVRYRGTGKNKPLLLIGHLDVVDALRSDWTMDPFTLTEKDGYFYGRGTTDMKGDDAAMVAMLIRFRRERFVPDRDVILALTEDEENGDANGVQWLVQNRRELIDAEFCINPDGGGGEAKNGKAVVMEFQTSEKVYADYRFEVRNAGGHSSRPVKENAIYRLSAALERLARFEFPLMLNETTRLFFERKAAQESGRLKADLLAMGKPPLDTAAAMRLAAGSPFYNAMLRTTCVATMLGGGHAPNALPQTAWANVNCRMFPDDTPDNVLATLKAVVADTNVIVTRSYQSIAGPRSAIRQDVFTKLEQLTSTMWPGVIVIPVMSTGATDGRILRAAGIPVFGTSGTFGDVDDSRAHGRDERVGVQEFYDSVEFTYQFVKKLCTGS